MPMQVHVYCIELYCIVIVLYIVKNLIVLLHDLYAVDFVCSSIHISRFLHIRPIDNMVNKPTLYNVNSNVNTKSNTIKFFSLFMLVLANIE